jgi:hypothetical protein
VIAAFHLPVAGFLLNQGLGGTQTVLGTSHIVLQPMHLGLGADGAQGFALALQSL